MYINVDQYHFPELRPYTAGHMVKNKLVRILNTVRTLNKLSDNSSTKVLARKFWELCAVLWLGSNFA